MGRKRKKVLKSKVKDQNEKPPQHCDVSSSGSTAEAKERETETAVSSLDVTITYDYSCQTECSDLPGAKRSMEEVSDVFSFTAPVQKKPVLSSESVWTDVNSRLLPPPKRHKCSSPEAVVTDSDVEDGITAFISTVKSGLKEQILSNPASSCEQSDGWKCDDDEDIFWTQAAEVLTQQEAETAATMAMATSDNLSTQSSNCWDKDEELEASILFQELLAEEFT